jgi:hypothetical protein
MIIIVVAATLGRRRKFLVFLRKSLKEVAVEVMFCCPGVLMVVYLFLSFVSLQETRTRPFWRMSYRLASVWSGMGGPGLLGSS